MKLKEIQRVIDDNKNFKQINLDVKLENEYIRVQAQKAKKEADEAELRAFSVRNELRIAKMEKVDIIKEKGRMEEENARLKDLEADRELFIDVQKEQIFNLKQRLKLKGVNPELVASKDAYKHVVHQNARARYEANKKINEFTYMTNREGLKDVVTITELQGLNRVFELAGVKDTRDRETEMPKV